MIKNNTILSSFDDKITLLEWLKKTEKALTDSIVEDFNLSAVDGQLTASLVLADGSSITSNSVSLDAQQLIPITNNEIDLLF